MSRIGNYNPKDIEDIRNGNFTAIDFETAVKFQRNTVCSVGIVVVRDMEIVERVTHLIKPPGNAYHQENIDLHGITPDKTIAAPAFTELYPVLKRYLDGQNVVAHNFTFDGGCIEACLADTGIPLPNIKAYCTKKIYNGKPLRELCRLNGIPLDHHNALSDAEACARLMINYLL